MSSYNKKGKDMKNVYRRRRIGALVIAGLMFFFMSKAVVAVMQEKPLDCGISHGQARRGDNFWHLAERHCSEEQHRLGDVVIWMMENHSDGKVSIGEWIALPTGKEG
jgi:hypothetical protein